MVKVKVRNYSSHLSITVIVVYFKKPYLTELIIGYFQIQFRYNSIS